MSNRAKLTFEAEVPLPDGVDVNHAIREIGRAASEAAEGEIRKILTAHFEQVNFGISAEFDRG